MTTARNYLADRGLAIRNARGKFSKEAKAALAAAIAQGGTFDDWNENGRIIPVRVPRATVTAKVGTATVRAQPVLASPEPVRTQTAIRIVDRSGISMRIGHCVACANAVSMCRCTGGPQASACFTKDAQSFTLV